MGRLASGGDAHLYAFVTSSKGAVMGGWAGIGKLCHPQKSERTSISRYSKGRVTWTSEVLNFLSFNKVSKYYYLLTTEFWICFFILYLIILFFIWQLIAHELGHNFGMHHDFKRSPSDVRRDRSGKACYGYMDYKQDTNYWSKCSVEFLTNQNKSCLKKLGGGTVITDPPRKLSCYFIDYLLTSLFLCFI